MQNRCVAAGCGNISSDSVSLFRFPKDPNLCSVWTRQVERTRVDWKRCLACRLFRRNSTRAETIYRGNLCFAVQRNRVLTSMALSSIDFQTQHMTKEATKVESGRKTCIENGK